MNENIIDAFIIEGGKIKHFSFDYHGDNYEYYQILEMLEFEYADEWFSTYEEAEKYGITNELLSYN